MGIERRNFQNWKDLIGFIQTQRPALYTSSQTSTVIPYSRIESFYANKDLCLVNLGNLPQEWSWGEDGLLKIRGPLTWKEAGQIARTHGRQIKTYPTEELAAVTAGVATSCTGERCFGYGTLRSQIRECRFLNYQGQEITLSQEKNFMAPANLLTPYQDSYVPYIPFKNAPFPRFQQETDLMIGTEGQLGIVTEVTLETTPDEPLVHFFITLPPWNLDWSAHLEVFSKVQAFRGAILSCELLDHFSLSYLPPELRPFENKDLILLEVKAKDLDSVIEGFFQNLKGVDFEKEIFEIPSAKFHQIRVGVPRAVFEKNSQMGVVKMGTDVQVPPEYYESLLKTYRDFLKLGVPCVLFGHFGDAHLHFNFLPLPNQVNVCQERLDYLYTQVKIWGGSPFAEHGVGLLKLKYIRQFHGPIQHQLFAYLKKTYDPANQFFPAGFFGLK